MVLQRPGGLRDIESGEAFELGGRIETELDQFEFVCLAEVRVGAPLIVCIPEHAQSSAAKADHQLLVVRYFGIYFPDLTVSRLSSPEIAVWRAERPIMNLV